MKKLLRRMNQVGGTLVECSLLTGLIAVVTIAALQTVGNRAADHFGDIGAALTVAQNEDAGGPTEPPDGFE